MPREYRRPGLLAGYRVLDLTEGGCLIAGKLMADAGADVIVMEKPGGNLTRNFGPFYKDIPHPEKSLFWFAYNTDKRGITLNIETQDGKEIFKRLVKTAHFLFESFSPGYLENLGLGFDSLIKINPALVMASITPFGQTGPYSRFKGSDLTTWAMGGYLLVSGDSDRPPVQVSFPQSSLHGGLEAASASMIAHWHRQRTGEGQFIDVSIQECVLWNPLNLTVFWEFGQMSLSRQGYVWIASRTVHKMCMPCKDGYVHLLVLGGGYGAFTRSSRAIVDWMNEEGMAADWLKNLDWAKEYDASRLTQETVDRVESEIGKFMKTRTREESYTEAVRRRIFMVPVNPIDAIFQDEQLKARKYWNRIVHPELNDILTYPGAFTKCDKAPVKVWRRAPLIGEHNIDIYSRELGYSKKELECLKGANII